MAGGIVSGRSSGGFASRLRAADIYRRIPKDLTESTVLGAVLSLLSLAAIVVLFTLNLKSMFDVHTTTRILIDHSEDGHLQINFKITLPSLSCELTAIDSVDQIGDRRHDLSGSAIYKMPTGGQVVAVEHAAKTTFVAPVYGNTTDMDHYGNHRFAIEVTNDNFRELLATYDLLMLDFHAPWCPHCQRFAPVWEHAAELTSQKLQEGPPQPTRLGMGSVDCTTPVNLPLCREQHIQAFPTVRIYRRGRNALEAGGAPQQGEITSHYEAYNGERSAEAVSEFALHVFAQINANVHTGAHGTDSNNDGVADSKVHSKGCTVQGSVTVSRVPGELHVVPTSRGHSLNMANVNMTHVLEHLSFGLPVPEEVSRGRWWASRAKGRAMPAAFPADMGGRYAQRDTMPTGFHSGLEHITHDHYVKVVPTQYRPLGAAEATMLYEYTISSNHYALEPPFVTSGEAHDGPIIKVAYDLSPLQVAVEEARKPTSEGILGMCSLLGGVYASSMLLESFLQAIHHGVEKHLLGKKTQ